MRFSTTPKEMYFMACTYILKFNKCENFVLLEKRKTISNSFKYMEFDQNAMKPLLQNVAIVELKVFDRFLW